MRISSNEGDPGYSQFCASQVSGKTVLVFLDGEEVKLVTVADEDQGFVERCVLDADGRIQIDPVDDNKVWMEIVTGDVEVKFA